MRKLFFSLVAATALVSTISAEPNVSIGEHKAKLQKAAGKIGKFARSEIFPKDYFLVHQNLPFLAGLSLHHPKSSRLGLSQKQIDAIMEIKKRTVPEVLKVSKKIKKMELELAENIAVESNSAESQYALVDKIGKLRIELTKAHLICINEVRAVLGEEQYEKLLSYATKLKQSKKQDKFRIDELAILPHPGKIVKMHNDKIGISKEQKNCIEKEIKAVYPVIFQTKIREAFKLEQKLKRMVAKGKTKGELKGLLDQIVKLKRDAMDSRIDALNHFKKIVSQEQWKKIIKMSK